MIFVPGLSKVVQWTEDQSIEIPEVNDTSGNWSVSNSDTLNRLKLFR